jgi:hypothetical protein
MSLLLRLGWSSSEQGFVARNHARSDESMRPRRSEMLQPTKAEGEMGNVVVGLTMSLDGFIAGPNDGRGNPLGDGGGRLFDWWSAGTERIGPDDRFKPPLRSAPGRLVELDGGTPPPH